MKKILIILASAVLCASLASAQTMADALTYSQTNYYGTARTLGMGNAVTAIGGDLGTIAINPAGGSVSSFSQFAFSSGWCTSGSSSAFAPSFDSYDESVDYSGGFENNKTRMIIPNVGVNMCFPTGERSGVLSWNFGFLVNRNQTFTRMMSATGLEGHTSMTGALAKFANGMPGDIIADNNMYDSKYSWNSIVAYDGGLINYNSDANTYYGSAETKTLKGTTYEYEMLGWLKQNIGTTTVGSRNDMIINYGANINDRLFIGASLNCPIIEYRYSEYYREAAQDPDDFPVTPEYYDVKTGAYKQGSATKYVASTYKYDYSASISGINLKLGFIWLPTDGLRLGAAFQTPTAYTIEEQWYVDVSSEFKDASQNVSAYTPTAECGYDFRAPYSANFGLAYTIGRSGLFSVDYEITDFSVMKFSEQYVDATYTYDDPFYRVNRLNKLFCGVQHSLRAGAEFRVLPSFSVRAGINLSTSPERFYTDSDGYTVYAADYDNWFNDYESGKYKLQTMQYTSDQTFSMSLGAGYASPGSFYADIAIRKTNLPDSYYKAYNNYLSHKVEGIVYDIVSPSVKTSHSLFDAVITFGWRF